MTVLIATPPILRALFGCDCGDIAALQGPETYCDATGHCMTGSVTITTRPGFDSMTGLGAPGANFVATLAKY
jgi:hypothetical protein